MSRSRLRHLELWPILASGRDILEQDLDSELHPFWCSSVLLMSKRIILITNIFDL